MNVVGPVSIWMTFIFAAIFCSCSTLYVTESTASKLSAQPTAGQIDLVLKSKAENIVMMQKMQFQLGRYLGEMGYIYSNCLVPDSATKDSVFLQQCSNKGNSLLLTVQLIQKQQDTSLFVVSRFPTPMAPFEDRYIGYVADLNNQLRQAGRMVTDTRYTWQTRLYDPITGQIAYSITAVIENPFNDAVMVRAFTKFLISDLVAKELIDAHYLHRKRGF